MLLVLVLLVDVFVENGVRCGLSGITRLRYIV